MRESGTGSLEDSLGICGLMFYSLSREGVIFKCKRRGIIRSAKEILDSFIGSGYYISNTLYSTFLEEVGEKEQ